MVHRDNKVSLELKVSQAFRVFREVLVHKVFRAHRVSLGLV
jgi:hypothetical protein